MTAPAGWRLAPLDPARDRAAVQAVYEAGADYVTLETGEPPGPDAAAAFFADAPPGRTARDCDKLGVFDAAGGLAGVMDLARAYPDAETFYIGFLMLRPGARSGGGGRAAVEAAAARARAAGATRLRLAVLAENAAGLRFWTRCGFVETRRTPPARIGLKEHVRIVMDRALG